MSNEPTPDDDRRIASAMRRLPRHPAASAAKRAVAFERVHAEWRAAVAPREVAVRQDPRSDLAAVTEALPRTRPAWPRALAASVLLAAVGVGVVTATGPRALPATFATVQTVSGAAELRRPASWLAHWTGARWGVRPQRIAVADELRVGDELRTAANAGTILQLAPTLALRVAPGSVLRFEARDRVALTRGRVYVESSSGVGRPAVDLLLRTPFGDVAHLGTRYLAEVTDDGLDVAVREGRVRLVAVAAASGAAIEAGAGEGLRVARAGAAVERRSVVLHDERWAWLAALPAPIDIENLTLDRFLSWYTAESGRAVDFGSEATRNRFGTTRLRGSVSGLPPDRALDVVLASIDLQGVGSVDGSAVRIEARQAVVPRRANPGRPRSR